MACEMIYLKETNQEGAWKRRGFVGGVKTEGMSII